MRNGQNKHRMRGRNRGNKNHNPLTRVYESNGPDVKIRGTASHIAEKYIQFARDATASGDPVAAENYYQHAEHYFRLIAAAQEQYRQSQPYQQQDNRDDSYEDGEEAQPGYGGEPYSPRDQQQPYQQHQGREGQPYQQREQEQPREQRHQGRDYQGGYQGRRDQRQPQQANGGEDEAIGLPSFITGSAPQPATGEPNGYEAQGERFSHRRRRRGYRGPRPEVSGSEGEDSPQPQPTVSE